MREDRNGLEVLERDECLLLLGSATLGRIGLVTDDGRPLVLPVNFHLDDDRILVLTTPGTKLDAALRSAVVAFEVDDFDAVYHAGWSIVASGVARELPEAECEQVVRSMPLTRWAKRGDCRVVEIALDDVSGRRLR